MPWLPPAAGQEGLGLWWCDASVFFGGVRMGPLCGEEGLFWRLFASVWQPRVNGASVLSFWVCMYSSCMPGHGTVWQGAHAFLSFPCCTSTFKPTSWQHMQSSGHCCNRLVARSAPASIIVRTVWPIHVQLLPSSPACYEASHHQEERAHAGRDGPRMSLVLMSCNVCCCGHAAPVWHACV